MEATAIPRTIEECCLYLDEHLHDEVKAFLKSNTKEKSEAMLHHSLGRRIRNQWGLWKQDSELYHYLTALGFQHADDMSGIIIHFYWKHINGLPWDGLDAEIKKYQDHWKGIEELHKKGVIQ